jgi:hypothetical protein
VRAGLEKAGVRKVLDDVADSDVLDEEPPAPKGKPANGAAKPGPPGAAAAEKKPSAEGKEASAEDADRPRPQPRYDSKSFGKWVTNNPEAAAELAAKVFKTQLGDKPDAWKSQFIAFENKRRRQSEADEKERAEIEAGKAEVERLAKEAREPVEDIIEAESKEEFPAIDKFIETTFKVNFDEYCRRRLRGINKETPTERAQKQKIAALEAKLAEKGKTEEPEPAKESAPRVSQKWVEREIGADHGVRELSDWQKKVADAYEASRDEETGDYDITIEDAAEQVLSEFLKKRTGAPPAATPRGRQRPAERRPQREPARQQGKAWSDDDEDAERTPASDINTDFSARLRNALDRAGRRTG